jgi:hypothetical protein
MGVSGQRHTPAMFHPEERTPRTHWIGGWVDPRPGLDTEARGKTFASAGGSPGHPVRSQTLHCLSYPGSFH